MVLGGCEEAVFGGLVDWSEGWEFGKGVEGRVRTTSDGLLVGLASWAGMMGDVVIFDF